MPIQVDCVIHSLLQRAELNLSHLTGTATSRLDQIGNRFTEHHKDFLTDGRVQME